jgi:hypothetical protein
MNEFLDKMAAASKTWEEDTKRYEDKNDAWWNSLSEQERKDAFYAVVKRIYQAEIVDRGTYRYVLYDVFGFDADAYVMGMDCGYMELHNSIYTQKDMRELRDRELAAAGIKVTTKTIKLGTNND